MRKAIIFLFALIALFLASFTVTKLVINWLDEGYNYQGKNGEYRIDVRTVGNITIYSPHVKRYNVEYIYNFRNRPEDLEDLYLEESIIDKLNRPKGLNLIYVTRDPDLGNKTDNDVLIAAAGFEPILGTYDYSMYQVRIRNTYTKRIDPKIPKIDCRDVSATDAIILLKLGEEERVYTDENECIIIEGTDGKSLIRSAEKFGYSLIGVF